MTAADLTLFDDMAAEVQLIRDHADTLAGMLDRLRPTMAVADVPVDGSVDVRWNGDHGELGPWHHIIGEQRCSADCIHLISSTGGLGPLTPDLHVQVKPHVVDDDVFVQDGGGS